MKNFHEFLHKLFPSEIPQEIISWIYSKFSEFVSEVGLQIPPDFSRNVKIRIFRMNSFIIFFMNHFRNSVRDSLRNSSKYLFRSFSRVSSDPFRNSSRDYLENCSRVCFEVFPLRILSKIPRGFMYIFFKGFFQKVLYGFPQKFQNKNKSFEKSANIYPKKSHQYSHSAKKIITVFF